MGLVDFLVLGLIGGILGFAVWYIRKEKRRGVQCVGCPDSAVCAGKCSGCSGCCGNGKPE